MMRILDFLLAFSALIILLPFLTPIIALLSVTGDGKALYYQKRKGKGGKEFFLIKLSTMQKNSPSKGMGSITVKDDPRIKFLGNFLRRWKINELPQVVNVLLGDLSIVGPRPLIEGTTGYNSYSEDVKAKIFRNRPGLTGIGSIVFRDEEAILSRANSPHKFYTQKIAPYKADLELWYVENKSFKVDILIIVCTIIAIILPKSLLFRYILPGVPEVPKDLEKYFARNGSL